MGDQHTLIKHSAITGKSGKFALNLKYIEFQIFDAIDVKWVNPNLLLEITCNQILPLGSKIVVVEASTLAALGRFTVMQPASGGYFAKQDVISAAIWWGFWYQQVTRYAHPRMRSHIAILLHQ